MRIRRHTTLRARVNTESNGERIDMRAARCYLSFLRAVCASSNGDVQ
jgi:hypothetical protein